MAKTREHPLIVRGASVRATIAVKEIAYGYRLLHDSVTRDDIKKAALVALPHRIVPSAVARKRSDEIILEIVQEVVFGIRSLEHGDPFKDQPKTAALQKPKQSRHLLRNCLLFRTTSTAVRPGCKTSMPTMSDAKMQGKPLSRKNLIMIL